jgi:hypothetical protein
MTSHHSIATANPQAETYRCGSLVYSRRDLGRVVPMSLPYI